MGVRNKTIIGLKYDVHIGVHRGEEVRNKTIIGLKFLRSLNVDSVFFSLEIRL